MPATAATSRVRLKSVAVPPEHGSWGFLFEPLLLGLGVAPSLPGFFLAVAVIGAFLARHPLKIAIIDRQRGKRYARTMLAERVALAYSGTAAVGLAVAVAMKGVGILLPLLLAVPPAVVLVVGYAQHRGRDLGPEWGGASALAAPAPSLALAGGKSWGIVLALWAILLARNIPTILYIRARLRLERDKPYSPGMALVASGLGVVVVLVLAIASLAPTLAVVAVTILLLRAAYGLSPYRRRVRTQTIGFLELGYGLLTVSLAVVGYALE